MGTLESPQKCLLGTTDVGKIKEKHVNRRKKQVSRITTLSAHPFTLAGNQPTLRAAFRAKRLVGGNRTHE